MAEFDAAADLREFIRQITIRFERSMSAQIAELRKDRELAERRHEENRAELRATRSELRDLREESRAQTQALLRMLDRLDDGGTAPAG